MLGYAYTLLYKAGGLKGVQMVESGAGVDYLEAKTGRSLKGTLLGDVGRSDMQAFILHQVCDRHFDYELALGRTYYATLCHLIPRFIWPDRPVLKVYEGTEVQWEKAHSTLLNDLRLMSTEPRPKECSILAHCRAVCLSRLDISCCPGAKMDLLVVRQ